MLSVGEHQHLLTFVTILLFFLHLHGHLVPYYFQCPNPLSPLPDTESGQGERGNTDWIFTSVVMAVAAQLDLNDIDSLSRVCRGVHDVLLQNRTVLLRSTLRCSNDDIPVDPESTLRYRARAGNWYYMEDTSRGAQYNGKSGSCARDLVAECRRCGIVVCRVSTTYWGLYLPS